MTEAELLWLCKLQGDLIAALSFVRMAHEYPVFSADYLIRARRALVDVLAELSKKTGVTVGE